MRTIRQLTIETDYKLRLTYATGEVVVADFKPLIVQGGVYATLSDPAYFSQAAIGERGRYVRWPGELDFSADALWLEGQRRQALARITQLGEEMGDYD